MNERRVIGTTLFVLVASLVVALAIIARANAQSSDLWFAEGESFTHGNASTVVLTGGASGGKGLRFSKIGDATKNVQVMQTTEDKFFQARPAGSTPGHTTRTILQPFG